MTTRRAAERNGRRADTMEAVSRRSRQRGVSLVMVIALLAIMIGLALTVGLTSEPERSLAAEERGQAQAFYAAEYAVAEGKAFLAAHPADGARGWTALLASGDAALCRPSSVGGGGGGGGGAAPGAQPKFDARAQNFAGWSAPEVTWQFCVHNNAEDPDYLLPQGAPTGDVSDGRDPLHLITIEAWGTGPGRASAHLQVTVGPDLKTVLWQEL